MSTSLKTQTGESYVIVQESATSDMRATSGRWNTAAEAKRFLVENPDMFGAGDWRDVYVEKQTITITTRIEHERVD